MIDKLELSIKDGHYYSSLLMIEAKINELIDAHNELEQRYNEHYHDDIHGWPTNLQRVDP